MFHFPTSRSKQGAKGYRFSKLHVWAACHDICITMGKAKSFAIPMITGASSCVGKPVRRKFDTEWPPFGITIKPLPARVRLVENRAAVPKDAHGPFAYKSSLPG